MVATYHSSNDRSRALSASAAILRPSLEKISARIAVSEYARGIQVSHVGGEPVVIPNGLYVDRFAAAAAAAGVARRARGRWPSSAGSASRARASPLLAAAFGAVAADRPGAAAAGRRRRRRRRGPRRCSRQRVRDQVTFLGRGSDEDKAAALRTADVYVAPNTGGESFGIVLVEAMAAGATVLASDIPAFRRVLDGGTVRRAVPQRGRRRPGAPGWPALLDDPARRAALDAAARAAVRRYDWSTVAGQIVAGLRDRRAAARGAR